MKKIPLKTFFILVIVSLVIRGYMAPKYGIWEDEALTINLTGADYSIGDVIQYCLGVDRCSFVYNLFLHFWTGVFGTGEIAAKIPSVLFGALTVGLLFLIAVYFMEEDFALIVGVVAAASPYMIYLSTEVRPYALLGLLGTFAVLCLVKIILGSEEEKKLWMKLHVAVIVVGIYTNPFMYLFWAGHLVFLFFQFRKNIKFLVPQLLILVFSIPHIFFLAGSLRQAKFISPFESLALQKFFGVIFRLPYGFIIPSSTKDEIYTIVSSFPYVLAIGFGIFGVLSLIFIGAVHIKDGIKGKYWIALGLFFLFLVWILFPVRLSPRQCSLVIPYFFILFGLGIAIPSPNGWHSTLKTFVLTLIGFSLFFQFTGNANPYTQTNWKDVITNIDVSHTADDNIFVLIDKSEPDEMNLEYSLPPEKYNGMLALFEYYTEGRITPKLLDPSELDLKNIRQGRVFILWNHLAYKKNPLPELGKEADNLGSILNQINFGKRLTLIAFNKK